jgi:uncharacterized protein (DUF169 family)
MSDYAEIAGALSKGLDLSMPPIAVSFADQTPMSVPVYSGRAPAGCLFWEEAAQGAFSTSAIDHEMCAIGVHTHHLAEPSDSFSTELGDTLKVMADLNYVTEEEVAALPVLNQPIKRVVYAPLAQTPLAPNVVLLFANSRQGSVISEAAQRVDGGPPPAMGRPACAIIPQVVNSNQAALCLGCCGARAYLDALPDDVALWGIPGSKLAEFAAQITSLSEANSTLTTFHERRRADVESGQHPTIRQSLERLQ